MYEKNIIDLYISIKDKITINGNVMSLLYDIVYELIELNNNKLIMIFISKNKNNIILKSIIDTNISIKDNIKIDKNITIKEKIYDTDIEIEFIIRKDNTK